MEPAFQDLIPHNTCFGCGPDNTRGLRIKSRWDGDAAVCTFTAAPHQNAGVERFVNGGILATVIDCHTICTATADAYRREGRPIGSDPLIWYVTGTLSVTYVRPAPTGVPLTLRAEVAEVDGRKTFLDCILSAGGEECAVGEVLAVRVPDDWNRGK